VHVINDLDIRDIGLTDHYLITFRLSITFCERSDVVQLLRRAPIDDISELSSLIRASSLCVRLTGSVSVDSYCPDLRSVIESSLDNAALFECSILSVSKNRQRLFSAWRSSVLRPIAGS